LASASSFCPFEPCLPCRRRFSTLSAKLSSSGRVAWKPSNKLKGLEVGATLRRRSSGMYVIARCSISRVLKLARMSSRGLALAKLKTERWIAGRCTDRRIVLRALRYDSCGLCSPELNVEERSWLVVAVTVRPKASSWRVYGLSAPISMHKHADPYIDERLLPIILHASLWYGSSTRGGASAAPSCHL